MGVDQGGKGRTFVILSTIKIKIHKIKPMEQENPHYYYKISTKTFSNYSLFIGLVSLLFMKYFQSVPEFPPVPLPPLLMSSVSVKLFPITQAYSLFQDLPQIFQFLITLFFLIVLHPPEHI